MAKLSVNYYHAWLAASLVSALRLLLSYLRILFKHASLPPTIGPQFDDAPLDLSKPYHHSRYLDPVTGAFPSKPLPHLPEPFSAYEDLLAEVNCIDTPLSLGQDNSEYALSKRPGGERWRAKARKLPVLDFAPLQDHKDALQRAHAVLAWLVHFYVHSTPPPTNKVLVVPASLSRPLVQVSSWLQIAPVLTYADTVLWNFELHDTNKPFSPNNMTFTTLFNASTDAATDETEFYRCCAWIEQRGFDCTKHISTLMDDLQSPPDARIADEVAWSGHYRTIAQHLYTLVPVVNDLTDILMSVKNSCRPNSFYSSIRPWYRGSDAEGDGLRWVYEGVEDDGSLELSGPSAGQTSTFHVLDALLGVQHDSRSAPFMERMLRYMPAEQRQLLRHLQHFSQILRSLVQRSEEVRLAYNAVLEAMAKFRTDHLQVAVRYVVSPKDAGKCPITGMGPTSGPGCPAMKRQAQVKSRGTGGNEVSVLLKGSRDSTKAMKVA